MLSGLKRLAMDKEITCEKRPLVHKHKWTVTESQVKRTSIQDLVPQQRKENPCARTRKKVPWS